MIREDLKEGDVYITITNDNDIPFLFKNSGRYIFTYAIPGECTVICDKFSFSEDYNYQEATPEQKHWLLECEKADKFISYDEAMKTFVKEWQLPKKWKVFASNVEEAKVISKWFDENHGTKSNPLFYQSHLYINYFYSKAFEPANVWYTTDSDKWGETITFEQFKQYVLKENKLPYNILKQEGDKILQVQNSEGSVFDIGDNIVSSRSKAQFNDKPGKIIAFNYNVDNTKILAVCNHYYSGRGISIDKIEHYIEPKVDEFVLPETWWVESSNKEELEVIKKYAESKLNTKIYSYNNENITFGYFRSTIFNYKNELVYRYNLMNNSKNNNTKLTFNQFKKYVLKEVEVKNTMHDMIEGQAKLDRPDLYDVKLPIVGEVEESLLDKAKRLYPIGTNIISCYGVKDVVKTNIIRDLDNLGLFVNCVDGESRQIYSRRKKQWAEIVQ